MSRRKESQPWAIVVGAIAITMVGLVLLFKPLAIAFHRCGLSIAEKRLEYRAPGSDMSAICGSSLFHSEQLARLDYAFHADFAFDQVEGEAVDILFERLKRFLKTLPNEPMVLECHSHPPYDIMRLRVCDRVGTRALWVKFHTQHNVPDLVERFGKPEEP
jgi:hypothetical protein